MHKHVHIKCTLLNVSSYKHNFTNERTFHPSLHYQHAVASYLVNVMLVLQEADIIIYLLSVMHTHT